MRAGATNTNARDARVREPKLSEPQEAEQAWHRRPESRASSAASIFEAELTDYVGDGFAAVLGEERIQLGIDSAECACAVLHQGQPEPHGFVAGQDCAV